ncbi:MAG: hypothetical protein R3B07_23325 [Polyangiaceae bacterium]
MGITRTRVIRVLRSPGARSGSHAKRAREDFPDLHPQKKKDGSAPKTGDNKLNSDHLTAEQKKHFDARKDEAKKKLRQRRPTMNDAAFAKQALAATV